jgi:hypothetical protein
LLYFPGLHQYFAPGVEADPLGILAPESAYLAPEIEADPLGILSLDHVFS